MKPSRSAATRHDEATGPSTRSGHTAPAPSPKQQPKRPKTKAKQPQPTAPPPPRSTEQAFRALYPRLAPAERNRTTARQRLRRAEAELEAARAALAEAERECEEPSAELAQLERCFRQSDLPECGHHATHSHPRPQRTPIRIVRAGHRHTKGTSTHCRR